MLSPLVLVRSGWKQLLLVSHVTYRILPLASGSENETLSLGKWSDPKLQESVTNQLIHIVFDRNRIDRWRAYPPYYDLGIAHFSRVGGMDLLLNITEKLKLSSPTHYWEDQTVWFSGLMDAISTSPVALTVRSSAPCTPKAVSR